MRRGGRRAGPTLLSLFLVSFNSLEVCISFPEEQLPPCSLGETCRVFGTSLRREDTRQGSQFQELKDVVSLVQDGDKDWKAVLGGRSKNSMDILVNIQYKRVPDS